MCKTQWKHLVKNSDNDIQEYGNNACDAHSKQILAGVIIAPRFFISAVRFVFYQKAQGDKGFSGRFKYKNLNRSI